MLYKRLMGHPPGLADLTELHPEVMASLTKMLAYDADTVAALALTFQVGGRRRSGRGGGWEIKMMRTP